MDLSLCAPPTSVIFPAITTQSLQREALAVRRRILHRVYAVRLRGGARAGLRRWRKFARDVRGIEQASSTADAWLRKQLLLTGLTATMGGAARGSVRNR